MGLPTILCTVGIRCSVGAGNVFQQGGSAILKSRLLKVSAMLLGTGLSTCVN